MTEIILWGSILLIVAVLALAFLVGYLRGVKRSLTHFGFLAVALLIAIFITKPVANSILSISISYGGETLSLNDLIIDLINSFIDISAYESLQSFIINVPIAIISPFLFLGLTIALFGVFSGIYRIFARIAFGKRKDDQKKHKPFKVFGGAITIVETFVFAYFLFAPINSLTGLYTTLATATATTETTATEVYSQETSASTLQKTGDLILQYIPSEANEAIVAYNNSAFGVIFGAGGLDNALFDYFSEFEIDGEEINVRSEVSTIANVYNEFVEIYNNITTENYSALDASKLKTSLENFLDGGLYKTVLADTITTYVATYDTEENSLSLPEVACDIIDALKTTFSTEGFDGATYLREDLLAVVDLLDVTFENEIIQKYNSLTSTDLTDLMQFVSENNAAVQTLATNALSLNLVQDAFTPLCSYGSTYLQEYFAEANTNELKIELNSENIDTDALISDLLEIVDEFLDLSEQIDLSAVLSGDITSAISDETDVSEVFTSLGTTLDKVRGLSVLVFEDTVTPENTEYVFDNILSCMGYEILVGDTDENGDEIDTYSEFFAYLITPIENAQQAGLLDISNMTSTEILDSVLAQLETNEKYLSETLMPFYNLSVLSLKEMIFDTMVDTIDSFGLLDIDSEADYDGWKTQLDGIGTLLNLLNRGEVSANDTTYTYIKYMMTENYDFETLMKSMRSGTYAEGQTDLSAILNNIFASDLTRTLTIKVFQTLDDTVDSLIGVKPTTFTDESDLTLLRNEVSGVVSIIESLLAITDELTSQTITIANIGAILDILKTEAYQNGSKNGVFNPIFSGLIWYLTGDTLDSATHDGETQIAGYDYIKTELNLSGDGYYTYDSYATKLAEILSSS